MSKSRKPIVRALTFATALAASAAGAGPFEDGKAAHDRGDYAAALGLWRPLAEEGNAAAQSNLATMYHYSDGVPRDYAEALKWYRRAAAQGNAEAQYYLGLMYDSGHGVARDAAVAVRWWREAAEQGIVQAQSNLGVMYASGTGVHRDAVQAHMWFSIAARQGAEKAIENLETVAGRMRVDEIAEARRLAREWMATHPR